MQNSGRFPLAASGRINLYRLFLESSHIAISPYGFVGLVVPSGFASDSFSQPHFTALHGGGRIVSLFDFENRNGIFPNVDRRYHFCLLTVTGAMGSYPRTDFVFFAQDENDLADRARHIQMSAADVHKINPITGTAPLCRSRRDMELMISLQDGRPIVADQSDDGWRIEPNLMFMVNSAMTHHRSADELEQTGFELQRSWYVKELETWLPLYEGKMVGAFDHRAASVRFDPSNRVRRNQPEDFTLENHQKPSSLALPAFWVSESAVDSRCGGKAHWLLVVKDVTSATNERTCIASIVPRAALTDSVPWIRSPHTAGLNACLLANLNSFALDFVARQKVAGLHLRGHYLAQFPLVTRSSYTQPCLWAGKQQSESSLQQFILPRVLELSYTAWDLEPFARDCGYDGPPFRWDESRRFLLRCELDAAFFHLYGINRDDTAYILDTFPIVRRKDEAKYNGEYKTKTTILEIYDALSEATLTGQPYQTRLDPPPADPRVAHPPREVSQ